MNKLKMLALLIGLLGLISPDVTVAQENGLKSISQQIWRDWSVQ